MESSDALGKLKGFYGQILDYKTNVTCHCTISQDWAVKQCNLPPGAAPTVLDWNLKPKENANPEPGVNNLDQNTQNLGVPGTSSSISAEQPVQNPVDENPGISILNPEQPVQNPAGTSIPNPNTQNLGVQGTSDNLSLLRPVHQNPTENLPARANPMNSSAAVGVNSVMVEGGPNPRSSKNPRPKKSKAATSRLGKRSSIQAANKRGRKNTSLTINDSPAGGRDRLARNSTSSRPGRTSNSQNPGKVTAAQENVGEGNLHETITQGPSMPSQMINTDLQRTGMSNLPLSNTDTPSMIDWSDLANLASSGALTVRNHGGVRSFGGRSIPGNSTFQKFATFSLF